VRPYSFELVRKGRALGQYRVEVCFHTVDDVDQRNLSPYPRQALLDGASLDREVSAGDLLGLLRRRLLGLGLRLLDVDRGRGDELRTQHEREASDRKAGAIGLAQHLSGR